MRFMSSANKKKKSGPWKMPTGEIAKRINSEISKLKTSAGEIDLADTPKKFYTAIEKLDYHIHMLSTYEAEGYIVDTSGYFEQLQNNQERIKAEAEQDFLVRAQTRMQREVNELKTDKARLNRALKFYQELELYYPKMHPNNVLFVKQMKSSDSILRDYAEPVIQNDKQARTIKYCPMCGMKITSGALFCGECGHKL